MIRVPFVDLAAQNQSIRAELDQAVSDVVAKSQFILGSAVERFETRFAQFVGTRHCVGLNSGTSALHLALAALDIGPGDEVLTSPHGWISTAWAISYLGATPVFADIDPRTYTLDPMAAEKRITSRTKAIIPVHLYGQMADMHAFERLAKHHGLALIEDAAQAHGACNEGRMAGSIGVAGCFSFYPGKNLGAWGEAGAVVTNDEAVARRIRTLRDHAQAGRHHHVEIGYNARMEGLQAAVLEVKLNHLGVWNSQRARHAALYTRLLERASPIVPPAMIDAAGHAWHLYVILSRGADRDRLRSELANRGITTAVHYPTPIPLQPAYRHLGYRPGDFPIAEDVMSSCLSLPMFAELLPEQIEYTASAVQDALAVMSANV